MTEMSRVLYSVLKQRHGAGNAITSLDICRALDLEIGKERLLRGIIEEYANTEQWPGLLCAVPGTGYFYAETIEEVGYYRKYLESLSTTARDKLKRFDAAATKHGFNLKGVA